jgi:hypothetical protein
MLMVILDVILLSFFMIKKTNISNNMVWKIVMVLLIVFKLFHMSLSIKEANGGGMVLKQSRLSFHLRSIQIYFVIFINIIKNQK